jgi:hypothetical protein
MKLKTIIIDNFSKFELLFLILVLVSFFMTNILKSSGFKIELVIFGLVLATAYFGFGFKLLGKHSANNGLWFSIICGIVYSVSVISVMYASVELFGKDIFLIISLTTLVLLSIFVFVFKNKSKMSKIFLNGQLVRIVVFILLNLVLCFK